MVVRPYGTWESPLAAEGIAASLISFQDVVVEGENIYWSEMRPNEKGRYVIVKKSHHDEPVDILPEGWSARTRVHEYGGAAFCVKQGVVYFTNDEDQRLYRMLPGERPQALTEPGIRFAECQLTPYGMIAIAESHLCSGEPENFLAKIDLETSRVTKLHSGADFYAFPALNQDKSQIAWISWNHPNMPWDNTVLWVAEIDSNGLSRIKQIDANVPQQSFFQPQWNAHNVLMVVSDKANWWDLYRVADQNIVPFFGNQNDLATPLWNLGQSTWGFFQGGIVCAFADKKGVNRLHLVKEQEIIPFDLPYTHFSQIRTGQDKIVCIAGASDKPTAVISIQGMRDFQVLRENTKMRLSPEYLSKPEHIVFPSENHRKAHAYFYPPCNPDYQGQPNTLPPLIVKSHGGPTANCGNLFNLEIQYWTSRGYALVDVNYGGSTGYGRAYREILKGNWGIVDVQDCEAAVKYLIQAQRVAPHQIAITGASAGGYTVLAALTFTTTFQVGASLYGVADCSALAKCTHKFESRYLDQLIGPYPEAKAWYDARSPIEHVEKLTKPVIFFQGTEDKIVPKAQAEKMYDALKAKGIKTALFLFEGEQHGFRKAENRVTVLKNQEKFFREALNLASAE